MHEVCLRSLHKVAYAAISLLTISRRADTNQAPEDHQPSAKDTRSNQNNGGPANRQQIVCGQVHVISPYDEGRRKLLISRLQPAYRLSEPPGFGSPIYFLYAAIQSLAIACCAVFRSRLPSQT